MLAVCDVVNDFFVKIYKDEEAASTMNAALLKSMAERVGFEPTEPF
jgi:hypothetical protein